MRASQIILESVMCRQASVNIYPTDPDELFNTCWLKIRERELREKDWMPDDPKRYFLRMMRNKNKDWQTGSRTKLLKKIYEKEDLSPQNTYGLHYERFMIDWLNEPTFDEDLMFLKDILTLALYCANINDACATAEMSRNSFWKYKEIAKQRLYDDYHAANNYDFHSAFMV